MNDIKIINLEINKKGISLKMFIENISKYDIFAFILNHKDYIYCNEELGLVWENRNILSRPVMVVKDGVPRAILNNYCTKCHRSK